MDSSAWNDYLRGRGRAAHEVLRLVAEDRIWLHPTVVGEVFLGGVDLGDGRLGALPMLPAFSGDAVLSWVRRQDAKHLRGVGWADCEIVHAAVIQGVRLVTSDVAQRAWFDEASRRPPD